MEKKDIKPGEKIPEDLIVRRYRDKEINEILVELRDMPDLLFRVTDNNRFLFKVNKEIYIKEDLELLETGKPLPHLYNSVNQIPDQLKPYLKKAFILKDDEGIHVYDQNFNLLGAILKNKKSLKGEFEEFSAIVTPEKDISKLDTNDIIPEEWHAKCKREKHGYSLRLRKLFFLLGPDYRISEKIKLSYTIDESVHELQEKDKIPINIHPQKEKTESIIKTKKDIKINKSVEPESVLSPEEIVIIVIEKFKRAIKKNNLQVDFFLEKRLSSDRYHPLIQVFKGDLSNLNEETKNGMKKNINRNLKGGLSLLKAALVHELYINSTIAGRNAGEGEGSETGKNLKGLWTFLTLLQKDGSLRKPGQEISIAAQKEMICFFRDLKKKYSDKTSTILRIYRKLIFDLEKGSLTLGKENVPIDKFRAILIYKLYENTNRLDRGDGISMIYLSREILDFKFNK